MKLFKSNIRAFVMIIGIVVTSSAAFAQQTFTVGIPTNQMNYFAAGQEKSQWCWAASIEMVLNYYGVDIAQKQIVARTYGRDPFGQLPNWTGSIQTIHRNLNNWGIDNFGYPYTVMAQMGNGAPSPTVLINELSNGRPVIIGYRTGPNSGHAVVVTAVSYVPTASGPYIQTITVRDPWPSRENIINKGRVVHNAAALANKIQAYWYVRVIR